MIGKNLMPEDQIPTYVSFYVFIDNFFCGTNWTWIFAIVTLVLNKLQYQGLCDKANISCSAKILTVKGKYFRLLQYQKRWLEASAWEMNIGDAFGGEIRDLPESVDKASPILITQQAHT